MAIEAINPPTWLKPKAGLGGVGDAVAARFWAKVDRRGPDECWPWLAGSLDGGYGVFHVVSLGSVKAHRMSYELLIGPIPEGLQLDHLRRNRGCVNPAHLDPVPNDINFRRGQSVSALNATKTHCIRGHEFTAENTMWRPTRRGTTERRCRACHRAYGRNWYRQHVSRTAVAS